MQKIAFHYKLGPKIYSKKLFLPQICLIYPILGDWVTISQKMASSLFAIVTLKLQTDKPHFIGPLLTKPGVQKFLGGTLGPFTGEK